MIYRKRDTGEILDRYQVRVLFPDTSFPSNEWNQQVLDFAGIDPVQQTPKPDDTELEVYVKGDVQLVDNVWAETWAATPRYSAEELAKIEQDRADAKWVEMRSKRNGYLAEMDVIVMMSEELTDLGHEAYSRPDVYCNRMIMDIYDYKEKLRQLPQSITDIDNIEWPATPLRQEKIDLYKTLVEQAKMLAEQAKLEAQISSGTEPEANSNTQSQVNIIP